MRDVTLSTPRGKSENVYMMVWVLLLFLFYIENAKNRRKWGVKNKKRDDDGIKWNFEIFCKKYNFEKFMLEKKLL